MQAFISKFKDEEIKELGDEIKKIKTSIDKSNCPIKSKCLK